MTGEAEHAGTSAAPNNHSEVQIAPITNSHGATIKIHNESTPLPDEDQQ